MKGVGRVPDVASGPEDGEAVARFRGGAEDRRMIERTVRPELGARKAAEITYTDIDRLHRKLTKTSTRKK